MSDPRPGRRGPRETHSDTVSLPLRPPLGPTQSEAGRRSLLVSPQCPAEPHSSSKASILQHSAFLIVQLSHPYMTTGKTIALMRQTFVGKVMSLLFNMLSRLVIFFLPRSKHLLISWLQSPPAVILEPPTQNKIFHYFHCFPINLHEVMGPDAMILVF